MKFILVFLFFSFVSYSQKDTIKFSLDNSLNGSYSKYTNNKKNINVGFIGDNTLSYKKIKFNTSTNYLLSFRDTITMNEFVEKTNIGFNNIFLSNSYNSSLTRSIKNDISFGLGYMYKFSIKKVNFSISYAVLYQKTTYINNSYREVVRNSFREKIKYNGGLFSFSSEIYYQPNFKSMKTDYIIYGNSKIIFLPKKKVNFILQDVINYISTNNVKMLHNLQFGIEYSFKN